VGVCPAAVAKEEGRPRALWPRVTRMRVPVGLGCLLALSACSMGCAPSGTEGLSGTYSYLVTPSGEMFRLLKTGPFYGDQHEKLGTLVFYAGATREVNRIETDAETLVAALGPEIQAAGEKALMVGVNVGYDPRKTFSASDSYNVLFALAEGRWIRVVRKGDGPPLSGEGPTTPPEDPLFPFDAQRTQAGAVAAAQWLSLLDAQDSDAAVAGMTDTFRSQVTQAPGPWQTVLQRRKGLAPGRKELYRMQTRPASLTTPNSSVVNVTYEARGQGGARVLERVAMVCDAKGCQSAGYGFQPIPVGAENVGAGRALPTGRQ
jgi:hypothetical protein